MSAYAIRRHDEETTCEWCGFPLYVGDRALQAGDWIYCGHLRRRAPRAPRTPARRRRLPRERDPYRLKIRGGGGRD